MEVIMDLKIFFATFTAIFFAELADKTQIVGVGMAAKSGKPVSVWLGSVAAYMVVTAFCCSWRHVSKIHKTRSN
jgi:putative Ca2+/H+ antiporter (TMEM165/GDT1 family)